MLMRRLVTALQIHFIHFQVMPARGETIQLHRQSGYLLAPGMFKTSQDRGPLCLLGTHPKLFGLSSNFSFSVCRISIGTYIKLFPPQLLLLPMPTKRLSPEL